jgi:hypothetical protein
VGWPQEALVQRGWEPEDLIACWMLLDEDWRLVGNKTGAMLLGSDLLLKFVELEVGLALAMSGYAVEGGVE